MVWRGIKQKELKKERKKKKLKASRGHRQFKGRSIEACLGEKLDYITRWMQANPAVKWSRGTLTLGQVEPNQQIFLAQEANWGNFRPSFVCVLLAYLLLGPKFPCLRQTFASHSGLPIRQ